MHIHGQIQNVGAADFYGIADGKRAAQARRAAETRKRLLKAGQPADASDPEAALFVDRWMETGTSRLTVPEKDTAPAGHDLGLA